MSQHRCYVHNLNHDFYLHQLQTAEVLQEYYYRARYYDSRLGRFVSRDPIGYADGANLYRGYFVPCSIEPFGTVTWELDEANCVLTMHYYVQLIFKDHWQYKTFYTGRRKSKRPVVVDAWTNKRMATFKKKFYNEIEKVWNANNFRIKPPKMHVMTLFGLVCNTCPCWGRGFSPQLKIHFVSSNPGEWAITEDWQAVVRADKRRRSKRSYSFPGILAQAYLWESDIQIVPHEFGHALGLLHPGSGYFGLDFNSPPNYSYKGDDIFGRPVDGGVDLMDGRGNTGLRTFYFDDWKNYLNVWHPDCTYTF